MSHNVFTNLTPRGRILENKDLYVWGCSPIYDDQGYVHVYYSCWPRKGGFQAWQYACEVHHASAPVPEGPYTLHGPVLKGTGTDTWDSFTIHNPSIYRAEDKFILLYMANDGFALDRTQMDLMGSSEEDLKRMTPSLFATKRIGMAVSASPNGPFQRVEGNPVIDAGAEGAGTLSTQAIPPSSQPPKGSTASTTRAMITNPILPRGAIENTDLPNRTT